MRTSTLRVLTALSVCCTLLAQAACSSGGAGERDGSVEGDGGVERDGAVGDGGGEGEGGLGDGGGGERDGGLGDGEPTILLAEDFDGLANLGTSSTTVETFTEALPGWVTYNDNGARAVGTGSATGGAIYSFGETDSLDRAIGGVATSSTSTQGWGTCITNGTGHALGEVTVSFVGEQWRGANTDSQSLTFAYTTSTEIAANLGTGDTVIHPSDVDPTDGWVDVAALVFVSPHNTNSGAVLGNQDLYRTPLSQSIPNLMIAPGQSFCVRWRDINDPSSDHGLAIDDLVITAMIFS